MLFCFFNFCQIKQKLTNCLKINSQGVLVKLQADADFF